MNLLNVENELILKNAELMKAMDAHEKFMKTINSEINELKRQKEMCVAGLDLDKIAHAESILKIRGLDYGEFSERCVREAIKDIALDTPQMSKQYFGVKNYAGWRHQTCDCPYGMGPTHGSIVFSVGLQNPRVNLTDDEKESCLYYLNVVINKEARDVIGKKGKVTA